MLGHEAIGVMREFLGQAYVFPRERLRRAYICFNQAGVYAPGWPVFLRLVHQRLNRDLIGLAPDFRQTPDARVDEMLSRVAQFAALFQLEETASVSRRQESDQPNPAEQPAARAQPPGTTSRIA